MAKMRHSVISEVYAGSAGSATFRQSRVGQQLTKHAIPAASNTPGQVVSRANFTKGSDGWSNLSKPQQAAWNGFAKGKTRRDRVTGKSYRLTGRQAFIGLSSKFAQIQPGVALPTAPPAAPFAGDVLTFTSSVAGSVVTITASGPNATSASTEILAQQLASDDRAPMMDDYVSKGFNKFTGTALTKTVTLGPGLWALATRFVCPSTGEEKSIQPLGTVTLTLALVDGGAADAPVRAPARMKKAA